MPLLVCTTDRPPELQSIGAPQTIDQVKLYGAAVRHFEQPGVPDEAMSGSWRSMASRLVAEARGSSGEPGPVHLNLNFRDPLVGDPGDLPPGRPTEHRGISTPEAHSTDPSAPKGRSPRSGTEYGDSTALSWPAPAPPNHQPSSTSVEPWAGRWSPTIGRAAGPKAAPLSTLTHCYEVRPSPRPTLWTWCSDSVARCRARR